MRTFSREQTVKWLAGLEKRASSAGVFCETGDGKLLIVKANYKKHWSIPGGIIDHNETPKQAAIRETKEEVGIILDPEQVRFIAVVDRVSKEVGHTYQFIFHAIVTEKDLTDIALQENEIESWALVSPEEVRSEPQEGHLLGKAIFHWANNRSGYFEQTFRHDN